MSIKTVLLLILLFSSIFVSVSHIRLALLQGQDDLKFAYENGRLEGFKKAIDVKAIRTDKPIECSELSNSKVVVIIEMPSIFELKADQAATLSNVSTYHIEDVNSGYGFLMR